MVSARTSLPKQGQPVNVRARRWIVSEVHRSTLPPLPLSPAAVGAPRHVVLGRRRIEPGARVVEKVALLEPADSDSIARADATVNGIRQDADHHNVGATRTLIGEEYYGDGGGSGAGRPGGRS